MAAEISAAQNISRGRAGGQIHLARVLRDELPAVAAVFATGAIDYRMVATIVARTENVESDRKAAVDAGIARHCVKWMRLSTPKLRDRVDLWVAKYDPRAVRVPPKVEDSRYRRDFETSAGMAGMSANVHAADAALMDAAWTRWRPPCVTSIRAPRPSAAPMRAGRWRAGETTMACQCGSADCAAAAERKALGAIVIHVLAEQATLDGTNDRPGYLPGFGVLPAESVRNLMSSATIKPLTMPGDQPAPGYRAHRCAGGVRAMARPDLSVSWV